MTYLSTKTYTQALGLSCAFRQWRADHSHCQFIHGYALQVRIEFKAFNLDRRNWVVDFGGLKEVKAWLFDTFDHRLLVAVDDPQRAELERLGELGLADVRIVEHVGCEAFAKMVFDHVQAWLDHSGDGARVNVHRVEVSEHDGNSAIYEAT